MLIPSIVLLIGVGGAIDKPLALGPKVGLHGSMPLLPVGAGEDWDHLVKSTGHSENSCWGVVKTGSPQVLLGGPGGQGTRVEVSPDTSRAWATTEVNPGAYGQSPEHGKVVRSLRSVSGARTNPQRLGIVQGVLASSPGQTWLSPLVRVQDLLGAGGGPKGADRVRPENKMDLGHSG